MNLENKYSPDLSPWQKACALAYGGGDYSHIAHAKSPWPLVEACGDTLFQYLMADFDKGESCESFDEAIARCDRAIDDICAVRDALEQERDQ